MADNDLDDINAPEQKQQESQAPCKLSTEGTLASFGNDQDGMSNKCKENSSDEGITPRQSSKPKDAAPPHKNKTSLSHHPSDPGRRRKKPSTKSGRRGRAGRASRDLSPMTDYECNSHKFEPPFYNHPPAPIGSSQSFTSLLLSRTASALPLSPTSLNRSSSAKALNSLRQQQQQQQQESSATSYWTESSSENANKVDEGKKTPLNRESSSFWLARTSGSTSSIQKIFQNYHRKSLLNRLSSTSTSKKKSSPPHKWVSSNNQDGNTSTPNASSAPLSETDDEDIPAGDRLARQSDVTVGGSRIPPETEYFGFVLYVGSMVVFIAYLLWAFLPIQMLHMLNIYYYPSRWWALAFPSFVVVTLVYIYVALLSYNTEVLSQPLDSLSVFVDEYAFITRDTSYLSKSSDGVWDLSLEAVNRVLYSDYSSSSSPPHISNGRQQRSPSP